MKVSACNPIIMATFASHNPTLRLTAVTMKYISGFILLIPLIFALNSCKTDFDITAPYKEITVVYGLLSQNDTTHYLRINKAFLGDGNALQYSTIADSSTYGKSIDVVLTETSSTGATRSIIFDTITIQTKDTGVFYAPGQLMYKADAILIANSVYLLNIRNKKSGNEVSSATSLIQDFSITKPISGSRSIGFNRSITTQQKFEWLTAENGRLYQPVLKFYYKESSQPGDTILRSVEWVFPSIKSRTIAGGEKMSSEYLNEDFFTHCKNQIPYNDSIVENAVIVRFADHFDLSFTVVGDEFSTYLDVNSPSTGLLLEKPSYTNIENGIGVFSCKYIKHRLPFLLVNEETKADLQREASLKFRAN